jgi:hypothetical protein
MHGFTYLLMQHFALLDPCAIEKHRIESAGCQRVAGREGFDPVPFHDDIVGFCPINLFAASPVIVYAVPQ